MRWDLFCRVIDNHGDIGVCWRLASRLAALGERVRLWVDDGSALAWMAPGGRPGVEVGAWPGSLQPAVFAPSQEAPDPWPADVVVEAFGCELPAQVQAALAARRPAPVWINLEYLSAEPYVERSHGLPSPQLAGPAAGLTKWFFYPGFSEKTGGLLREPGLPAQTDDVALQAADRHWLGARGWAAPAGMRVASLFGYPGAAGHEGLGDWLESLAALQPQGLWLLAAPGPLQQAALDWARHRRGGPAAKVLALPWLAQPDYDRVLRHADLNAVRGEDSLVRAIWASRPFVWQAYRQHDGAHWNKIDAFVGRLRTGVSPPLARALQHLFQGWNAGAAPAWPDAGLWPEWQAACRRLADGLAAREDLAAGLIAFARRKGAGRSVAGHPGPGTAAQAGDKGPCC
jgi:uncharacterized repeat protein (TIGR03837 family)